MYTRIFRQPGRNVSTLFKLEGAFGIMILPFTEVESVLCSFLPVVLSQGSNAWANP
jgi:hypothetical protein